MLATAIAAPKIGFDTFAMTAFSAMLSTRRRLDYLPQIPSHFGLSPPRNSVMHLHRGAADRSQRCGRYWVGLKRLAGLTSLSLESWRAPCVHPAQAQPFAVRVRLTNVSEREASSGPTCWPPLTVAPRRMPEDRPQHCSALRECGPDHYRAEL